MPDADAGKAGSRDSKNKNKPSVSFSSKKEKRYIPHVKHTPIPISYYWLKDLLKEFASRSNFPDALAIAFAIISASMAFPYFPIPILGALVALAFILTMYSPLIGLMLLLFETLTMFIYQAPLLAWTLAIFIGIALLFGFKHYRTIIFIYAIMMLSLSGLGAYLILPGFVIGTLYVGFRRAVISTIVIITMISMLSGLTQTQSSAPIVYSYQNMTTNPAVQSYLSPSKNITTIATFGQQTGIAFATFLSFNVSRHILDSFSLSFNAITHDLILSSIQIFAWLLIVFAMISYVIKSRSGFKGAEASLFSALIVFLYIGLASYEGQAIAYGIIIAFILTPTIIFTLEYNNIGVVKALEVMKQDFIGKFGEAFEDITSGTKETLDDVANYEETKQELRQALLSPIEHREISGAYNVKPAKGVLLFGPPGNGKTLIMRALANDVRARFFYVKTSSLVSPYQGESLQALSKIFNTVRKNPPAILFFDEIDGIASKRELQESESNRQILSTLLSEMDGFQKIDGVVIVGATNAPHMLDESILRPGRFDKIIYMALPTREGRAKILEYYLRKLPIQKDMGYNKLAALTDRYSGADIKSVCEEVARDVADEAVSKKQVLEITFDDIAKAIKKTKPSTPIASIERYNTFKLDFERRTHREAKDTRPENIKISDVVGLEEAKRTLYEAVEVPMLHPELVRKYDVQNIKGILLFGPPGVGKTMLIRAVSNEIGDVNVITLSGSDIASSGLENSLQTIKDTFNRAKENPPAIIFIDEIEVIVPNRDYASDFSSQITSEFLQNIDGLKVLGNIVVIGATNRPDKLDPSILRAGRFDRLIFIAPPNREERIELFKKALGKAPCEDIDYGKLADMSLGYTGADITNICRQAKLNALESNISTSSEKRITMDDIMSILTGMKPSAPSETLGQYMQFLSIYKGR